MASSSPPKAAKRPNVLCAGIAVQDIVMRVPHFPLPGGKSMADNFLVVCGGCAVNAAIAVARLDGNAHYAGPLGDENDAVSNQLIAELKREGIGTSGVVRVSGAKAPVSAIMIDAAGERMIATYRDQSIEAARPANPDALVVEYDRAARRQPISRFRAADLRSRARGAALPWCSMPTGRPR